MRFEVFIPRQGGADGEYDTLTVDADHWTEGLKTGLVHFGGEVGGIEQAICTVRDDGWLQVNEASGATRVFFLRELEAGEGGEAVKAVPRGGESSAAGEQPRGSTIAPGSAPVGSVVETQGATSQAPKAVGGQAAQARASDGSLGSIETAIAAIYEQTGHDAQAMAQGALDLALQQVPSEAGSVFFTHLNGQDLYFAAARGPGSEALLNTRIPMSAGIVGFCTMEGVCLGVTDVQRDTRFFDRVSKSLGFATSNILCVPVLSDGVVYGALELINHKGGPFTGAELQLTSFIGYQLAEQLKKIFR